MRDDIKDLTENKIELFKIKLDLINKLLLNESEKIFLIKSDNIEKAARITEEDNEIIDQVNVIDYKISSLERIFAQKVGIKQSEIYSFLLTINEGPAVRLMEIVNILSHTMKELITKKNHCSILMEQASQKIQKDLECFKDYISMKDITGKCTPTGR